MNRRMPSKRAAALLITLATIVLVTVSLAALATAAASAADAHRTGYRAAMAEDLLLASDQVAAEWLRRDSARVSVPVDSAEPLAEVFCDSFDSAGQIVSLTLTSWDQQGMAPISLGRTGSPMRLALPVEAQRAIDALVDAPEPHGLDQFDEVSDAQAFPSVRRSTGQFALGGLIATHTGDRRGVAININTAPMRLLEAALREAGAGGLGRIVAARREGKPARIGDIDLRPKDGQRASTVTLSDISSTWAIRTDISIGPLSRSWWSVWQRRSGTWRIVQRLEIPR